MVQTYLKIYVHVVNIDICWKLETYMNVYKLHKKTCHCALYKLKIVTKHKRNTQLSTFFLKMKSNFGLSSENFSIHV